jgi:DNA-binding NarL/FixJ family response regulator
VKILIADDHALFRDSLRSLLTSHDHEVVGEASTGEEAVDLCRRLAPEGSPDVVLMDLSMPGMNGLEATRRVLEVSPGTKVVILTASDDDDHLFEAIKAGASGYLLKDLEAERFFALLDGVARDEPAITPRLARKVLETFAKPRRPSNDPDALTDREREVLEAMVGGVTSNRKLARELDVSENTVKFHVRNILDKLHIHDRAQAVGYALRHGLVSPSVGSEPRGDD